MSRIFPILILFILCWATVNGQYQDLVKNKNITWIAEFEMELSFDLDQTGDNTNEVILKKFLQPRGANKGYSGNWLTQYLFNHLVKGEVLSYKTPELITPYTIDQILKKTSSTDTVITFDPETFEQQIQVIKNEVNPGDIKICRTKQAIYFSKKTGKIGTCLIAVAPLLEINDQQGNPLKKEPLGWIKMEDMHENDFNENLPEITWAAAINTKATFLDLSRLKVVKGGLDFRKYLYEVAMSKSYPLEDGRYGYDSGQFLSKEEIENVYKVGVDTIITFDPTTYEEKIEVIKNDFDPTEVNNCRLVQDWFYLPEKKLLVNRLKSIAPIVKINDLNGQFRYHRPLYYIRY